MNTRMMWVLGMLVVLASPRAQAGDGCQELARYSVAGISVTEQPLSAVIRAVAAQTPWQVEVPSLANESYLSLRNVSGPLDKVLDKLVERGGSGVSYTAFPTDCRIVVTGPVSPAPAYEPTGPTEADRSLGQLAATPSPEVVAPVEASGRHVVPSADVLPAGRRLSEALQGYVVTRGWQLRWMVEEDYVIDVEIPIPAMDVIDGVTFVVQTYQSHGGLQGAVPRFARSNSVVVIEKMGVRDAQQNVEGM